MQFKLWIEDSAQNVGYGIYEEEAFKNRGTLSVLQSLTQEIGSKVESHPEEQDAPTWNIKYIRFNPNDVNKLESIIKKGMIDGWYSLLWTPNEIRVIFNTNTHIMTNTSKDAVPSFSAKNLEGIVLPQELDINYMKKFLAKGIKDFAKQLN